MNVMGWCLVRADQDRVLIDREGPRLTLRVAVPDFYAWRLPRVVLWGGRKSDVQVGSPADAARQESLRQRQVARRLMESMSKTAVAVTGTFRDELTPQLRSMAESMAEFQRAFERARHARRAAAR